MTVTLRLTPLVEAAAQAEAQVHGLPLEHYLESFLETSLPRVARDENPARMALMRQRQDALARLQGRYAHLPGSSADFAAAKADEKAGEERHWLQSNFSCSLRIGG